MPNPHDGSTLTAIDGHDALAFVIIRPGATDDAVSIEAAANGMSKSAAAYVLRHVAEQFEQDAAEPGGDTDPCCSAALLPVGSDPAEPCVRRGRHDEHKTAEGRTWTSPDAEPEPCPPGCGASATDESHDPTPRSA